MPSVFISIQQNILCDSGISISSLTSRLFSKIICWYVVSNVLGSFISRICSLRSPIQQNNISSQLFSKLILVCCFKCSQRGLFQEYREDGGSMNNLLLKRAKRALVGWFFISFQQNNILCDYAIMRYREMSRISISPLTSRRFSKIILICLFQMFSTGFYFKNIERIQIQ